MFNYPTKKWRNPETLSKSYKKVWSKRATYIGNIPTQELLEMINRGERVDSCFNELQTRNRLGRKF